MTKATFILSNYHKSTWKVLSCSVKIVLKEVMQFFPKAAWRHLRLRAHWLISLDGGRGVSWELQRLLSLFYLWEESVGGAKRQEKFSSLEGKYVPPI